LPYIELLCQSAILMTWRGDDIAISLDEPSDSCVPKHFSGSWG
jgi:hypothetical protein